MTSKFISVITFSAKLGIFEGLLTEILLFVRFGGFGTTDVASESDSESETVFFCNCFLYELREFCFTSFMSLLLLEE